MAPSIQVFVQVAILFCVMITCIGGITDWEKAISLLENKVNVQQEEIKSLHQMIEQLGKRLQSLEVKGEFVEVQICTTCSPCSSCLVLRPTLLFTTELLGFRDCMLSLYVGEWEKIKSAIRFLFFV